MPRIRETRRIIEQDYDPKIRPTIRILGNILNNFMEQVIRIVNGNIDSENIADDIITFKVTVDASGIPTRTTLFRSKVSNPSGVSVIKAINKTDSSLYPTNQPFINFVVNSSDGKVLKILKVTGLQADNEYELTVKVHF